MMMWRGGRQNVCGIRKIPILFQSCSRKTSLFSNSARQAFSSQHIYGQEPIQRDDQGRLLSRVSGPTTDSLSEATLAQFWQDRVRKHEDRPALIVRHEPSNHHEMRKVREAADDSCIRWTFGEMDEHIRKLVRGMRSLGVRKGDRVAVLMMNSSNMASLQFATAFIGAILVTLNPSYTSKELLRALNHVGAKYLFIVPSLRSSIYLDNLHAILPSLNSTSNSTRGDSTIFQDENCPTLQHIVLVDNLTGRPKGWESESILGKQDGYTFETALERLNGRGIDYRSLLVSHDSGSGPDRIHSEEEEGINSRDIINLQLTSGTTGAPKAVALSSRNLVNNGIMLGDVMHLNDKDILTNVPPLFHCFGLTLGNLAAWSRGSCILYPSEGFQPVRTLRAASQEKATAIHGVPAHFIAELDILRRVREAEKDEKWDEELTEKYGISSKERWQFCLRTGFTSGSTVPIELMHAIMDDNLLGAKEQTVVYGMTETSPVSFACDTDAPVRSRCETVGRIVSHAHAKIVDPEDESGKPLPVGQVGELCTGGYLIMEGGYWNDVKKTDEVLQKHSDEPEITWMRTGDLAVIHEDGYTEIRVSLWKIIENHMEC
jgi:acyl-CoA synthetase (AMP-forming)/AMP-acid ligase II